MFLSKEIDQKLILAFERYNKELCESLPTDDQLKDITFSQVFEKKMQKLIKAQKKSYYYLINTVGKRVAVIILAIMISLTATVFGVKAIRESVIEFITETFERFTNVIVRYEEPPTQTEIIKAAPQYIPEGYTVESEMDIGGVYRKIYRNQENISINYIQQINFGTIYNLDTENVEFKKIYINSLDGIKYVKNKSNIVVFADENYLYTIQGQIPFDELIKIAESIKTE